MITPRRPTLALLALAVALGCQASFAILGPVTPEEVTITLEVSGGFAGVQYSFVVDGAAGVVRGVSCGAFCDFEPGEVILAVSDAQVAELGRRLDQAGVMRLDGRDFGTRCCDDFHYALTYERGGRTARLTGDGALLPPAVADALGLLGGLRHRTLPILVSPDTRDTDWPRDPYTLGEVTVEGLTLSAELTWGGGCAEHRVDLVAWGGWMESFPVQINALLTHDDGDDPCDAVLTEWRRFELRPLREAYEEAYGPIGSEGATVILRLWDPLMASPLGRLVEVRL
ncbi:MAG TPA: hypothetical protein VK849_08665 [Longimicrobiales bacterium]|nr:hypothetical protein [Longimicrobiales bacterium]